MSSWSSGVAGVVAIAGTLVFIPAPTNDQTRPAGPVYANACEKKCDADYEEEAARCGKMEESSAREKCRDAAYNTYKHCRAACQNSQNNNCRKKCEEEAEACEAECRKLPEDDKAARRKCWIACNKAYAECIKKCKD
jgi:hypothetical protein